IHAPVETLEQQCRGLTGRHPAQLFDCLLPIVVLRQFALHQTTEPRGFAAALARPATGSVLFAKKIEKTHGDSSLYHGPLGHGRGQPMGTAVKMTAPSRTETPNCTGRL